MKSLIAFSIILAFSINTMFAQSKTCNCKTDLDFIVEKIKRMPSYKKQIKGDKLDQFITKHNVLSEKMKQPILIEDCYKMLLEQMSLINDIHTSLSFNSIYLAKEVINDEQLLTNFKNSSTYINHPKTTHNPLELQNVLALKDVTDLEGIYNYKKDQKIGVYFAENKRDLIGVVLESNLNHWEVGQIRFYANHTLNNKYNLYYYNAVTRSPGFVKSLTFENGRLWHFKKEGTNNHELSIDNQPEFNFKQISDDTQYLYFANFSNRKKSELIKFYKDVEHKISAQNIIVDLRSNSGGNKKFSDPFLKLLKDKNVYILTNSFTASNGEQFTVKLKGLKKAKHLGQTTRGVIAYGKNYGYNYNTPSGCFKITPTDMNFHKYIEYEGKGVEPEIPLDFDKDWIEQTLEVISKHN